MANIMPSGAQPISTSTSGTTGALGVTLGATTNLGRSVILTGFSYAASGATGAAIVTITAAYTNPTGSNTTLGTWTYPINTTTAVTQPPLVINLIPPMISYQPITGATNTNPVGSIVVTATAAGAGAVGATLSAWGYIQ